MELTQEKINLIERVVKSNRKFAGNEDLFDDFFNETCKRSLVILWNVNSEAALEAYLHKIATTSIINVLKNAGRLRRRGGKYIATHEVPIADFAVHEREPEPEIQEPPAVKKLLYKNVEIKNTPEDFVIKQEILNKINETVRSMDNDFPEKQYLYIFNLRYARSKTQKEIASALGLSQSEVSKRLMKLMECVKQVFNQGGIN